MSSSTWSLTVMTMMMMTIMEADGDNVLQRLSIHEHFSQVSVNHVTCGGQKGMINEVNSEKKKSQIRNKLHFLVYTLGRHGSLKIISQTDISKIFNMHNMYDSFAYTRNK